MLLDSLILLIMGGCIALLFLPALRNSDDWRATVTPLASIIGSGFLVVAPLLGYAVGSSASCCWPTPSVPWCVSISGTWNPC